MKHGRHWLLVLALCFPVFSVLAEELYVSPSTGQDISGCGSPQSPCASFRGAMEQSTTQNPSYFLFSGVYSGINNTNLVITTSSTVQAADDQSGVVFDCQDRPDAFGLQFTSNGTLQHVMFTNCNVGVIVNETAAFFQLHEVNFTHCTRGLESHAFEFLATNLTVTHCDTGVVIQSDNAKNFSVPNEELPEMQMTGAIFFNCSLASMRVNITYDVQFTFDQFVFVDTAGISMLARGMTWDDCRMSNSRFQGVWPVDGDAEGSLVTLDGYLFMESVEFVQSVSCGIAVRGLVSGDWTTIVLYIVVDDTCDIGVKKTGAGQIRVQYSDLSTASYGVVLSDMDKADLKDLNLSGCTANAIVGNGTASYYNIGPNTTFDHTGPLHLENQDDTICHMDSCFFHSTQAIMSGGSVVFNEGSYDNDGSAPVPENGGFISLAARGNTQLTLEYMTITGGRASGRGGAVYIDPNVRITISHVQFTDNQAGWGGAVYANQTAHLYATDSNFTANQASHDGGALYSYPSTNSPIEALVVTTEPVFQLLRCHFTKNQASEIGGAVFMSSFENPAIGGALFNDNQAVTAGGLFAAGFSYLQVWSSNFTGNVASEDGGGMAMQSASPVTLQFTSVHFTQNTAQTGACISCCQETCSNRIQFDTQLTSDLTCPVADNHNEEGTAVITCSPFFYPSPPGSSQFHFPYWLIAFTILLVAGVLLFGAWFALHRLLQKKFPSSKSYSSVDLEES